MLHKCRGCGHNLVVGENITQARIDHCDYICKRCKAECDCKYNRHRRDEIGDEINERQREYRYRTGRRQPMSENKSCASFLGVIVAERVISHVFKNVKRMPIGNHGFDIICNRGMFIDVKSSCIYHSEKCADRWQFLIKKNHAADYFLLLAFDNREDLNPMHMWLVPGKAINDKTGICITTTRLAKWDRYKLDVDKVVACCDVMRGE